MTFTTMEIEVLAAAGLSAVRKKNANFNLFSHNFSADSAQAGTGVVVPFMGALSASIWSSSTGYTPANETITGRLLQFGEPIEKTVALTPQKDRAYNFEQLANVILPSLVAAVVDENYKRLYTLAGTLTFPQITGSTAHLDQVDSGSIVVDTSGSSAAYVLVGAKYDRQLKSSLAAGNLYVGAQIINGQARAGYSAGEVDAYPTYTLTSVNTTVDAFVGMADSIVCAARLPNVNEGSIVVDIVDPLSGFPIRTFIWEHPTLHVPVLTATNFFVAAVGRTGFGARLKIN